MRDQKTHKTALLLTDDPAVENAARMVAKDLGDVLQLLKSDHEATCCAFDAWAGETFAIIDLDAECGTRAMFRTLAGLVPVVAVGGQSHEWLQSLLHHHRIYGALAKPVSSAALKEIVCRIRDYQEHESHME